MRPRVLLAIALSLALGLFPGCARRETNAGRGTREGVLHVGNQAEPQSLDPHLVTAYTDQNILLALFEGLCALDEQTSRPVPAAAESWDVSADGLAYTFHLRPNLRWSNGDPLTAGAFVDSWRRMLSPALAAEYAYLLHPIRNAAAIGAGTIKDPTALGATAPDPLTIRIELEHPTPYLPALTAQPAWFPVNTGVLSHYGRVDERHAEWTRAGNLVGNGPFILSEWTPNARVVVARNPQYRDAASVRLNRIVFYPIENPDVEERAFRAGQLHLTYALPTSKIPVYQQEQPRLLRLDPFLQTVFLRFNVTRPPFDRREVRRALSMAIDRASLAATVLRGAGSPADHFTPPNCAGYTARATVPTDFSAARALLAQAGFSGGGGLPPIDLQVRNDEFQPRIAEVLQAAWKRELGVTVNILPLEQKTWIANQQSLNYTLSGSGWIGDFVDPVTFLDLFVSDNGNNWTGWKDAAYDALIARAAAERDPARRYEIFQEAESRLLDQSPIAPLYFGVRAYLIDPAVQGWQPALLGFHQYAKLSLSPTSAETTD